MDGRLAAAYQPQHGIRIAVAQGPVLAIATGQRVECLLLNSGAGTLSPLAAWEFEQQVSAVAVLEMPASEGTGSEVSTSCLLPLPCWHNCLFPAHRWPDTSRLTSSTEPCSVIVASLQQQCRSHNDL